MSFAVKNESHHGYPLRVSVPSNVLVCFGKTGVRRRTRTSQSHVCVHLSHTHITTHTHHWYPRRPGWRTGCRTGGVACRHPIGPPSALRRHSTCANINTALSGSRCRDRHPDQRRKSQRRKEMFQGQDEGCRSEWGHGGYIQVILHVQIGQGQPQVQLFEVQCQAGSAVITFKKSSSVSVSGLVSV